MINVPDTDLRLDVGAELGRCVAVEYEQRKGRERSTAIYRHEFGPSAKAKLIALPQGKHVLIIVGNFAVVGEGIADRSELETLGY